MPTSRSLHRPSLAPWSIDRNGDIQDANGNRIADMSATHPNDRALMVAAPLLLAELERAVEWVELSRAVIASVRGPA